MSACMGYAYLHVTTPDKDDYLKLSLDDPKYNSKFFL